MDNTESTGIVDIADHAYVKIEENISRTIDLIYNEGPFRSIVFIENKLYIYDWDGGNDSFNVWIRFSIDKNILLDYLNQKITYHQMLDQCDNSILQKIAIKNNNNYSIMNAFIPYHSNTNPNNTNPNNTNINNTNINNTNINETFFVEEYTIDQYLSTRRYVDNRLFNISLSLLEENEKDILDFISENKIQPQ